MIKSLLIVLGTWALGSFFMYLIFSFVFWDGNLAKWSSGARYFLVCLSIPGLFFGTYVAQHERERA